MWRLSALGMCNIVIFHIYTIYTEMSKAQYVPYVLMKFQERKLRTMPFNNQADIRIEQSKTE